MLVASTVDGSSDTARGGSCGATIAAGSSSRSRVGRGGRYVVSGSGADAANPPAAGDMWVGIGERVHAKIADRLAAARHDHVAGILEQIEADLVPAVAPFLAGIVDDESLPLELRDLVRSIVGPEHFGQSVILGIAVGAILAPVLQAATAPFVQGLANNVWQKETVVPLSPAEIALGVLRHNPNVGNPYVEASKSGISQANLDAMVYNTGEPISIGDGLLLFRRGQMDQATLQTLVRQSRVRDEWFAYVLDLQYQPPGAGEVIAGRLKGHLDDVQATQKLSEAGVNPDNYPWLLATAGRPPGIEQMLHLLNRGAATMNDVDAAVRQSDINDAYLPFVHELRWYVPPVRSVMAMLRANAITDAQATTLFNENGVRPADIPGYLAEAHHSRTSAAKELSQAQILRMYAAQLLDNATASSRLTALGYTAADVTLFLELADHTRAERLQNQLISKVGSLYVNHKLTQAEAVQALTADQVPAAAQTDLFHAWDIERTANVHKPTPAQVVGAFRRGEISAADTKNRLYLLGVQATDLPIVVADGWPPGKGADARAAAAGVVNA